MFLRDGLTLLRLTILVLLSCRCQAQSVEISGVSLQPRSFTLEGSAMAAGDFNGDGHFDLAGAEQARITIFLGDGEGNLNRASRAPAGESPVAFALSDLDEDGEVDIVVANHDTDYLTVLLGRGDGTFSPAPISPLTIPVKPHPHAVHCSDMDRDGHADLIVDHRGANGMLILRGSGEGTFGFPGTIVDVGGDPYRGMAVGDLNRDGHLDLVTPNPHEIAILLNSGEGFRFVPTSPIDADTPFAVELGDFNGDGILDVVSGSGERSSLVEMFFGDGTGGFTGSAERFRLAPGGKNVAVGDLNGDGIDDAAVVGYNTPEVMILIGGRDRIRSVTLPAGEHPWGLVAADFDEDGIDDLIVADDSAPEAILYLSGAK